MRRQFLVLLVLLLSAGCSNTPSPMNANDDVGFHTDDGTVDLDSGGDFDRFLLLDTGARPSDCESVDGTWLEIDSIMVCVFKVFPGNHSTCPVTHPYQLEIGNHLVCADNADVDIDSVYERLDAECQESVTDTMCARKAECEFVPVDAHYVFVSGRCEQAVRGVCVFVPDDVGQLDMCLTRETITGDIEVVKVDGKDSPTWDENLDVRHQACDCLP